MRDIQPLGSFWIFLFALVGGYLFQIIDGANLIINPTGETQNQPAGKGFALTCQAIADDTSLFSQIKWIGPRGEIAEGSAGPVEVTRSDNSLVLVFKSSSTEDSGTYNCTAVYANTERFNVAVNLIFYQDITWEDCLEQQALVINKDGKIRCRVSANPPASITWTKDNEALEKRYVTETDGVRVSDVVEEDKGEFSVRAMVAQTGRFQYRKIKVEVYLPPEIIDLAEKAEAVEGNEATMNCRASGFPTPSYSWFDKDRRNLSNVEGHIVDSDLGILTFQKVKKEDRGTYTCLAKNPAGESEQNLQLSVIVKPEIKQFDNATSVENQDVQFRCTATGDPLPELNIRKDGQDRAFTVPGDERITLSRRNERDMSVLIMTIKRTVRSDDGLYYCMAENKGAHVEKVGHLTVEFGPVMGSTPSTSVKTWNGNPVNITCIAESIPNATIKWSFNGQEIRDSQLYTIYGRAGVSNLMVKPSDFNQDKIYGVYKCDAENPHGSQFINIELTEARPPSIILKTSTEKRTATTLTFNFQPPIDTGGLPIRVYVVKYNEEIQTHDKVLLHEWSEGMPYILENLKPRTAYRFRFAAKNDVGIGEWSEEMRVQMPEESTPERPRFITPGGNMSTYPDRYQIRWTEPLDNGRKIDYFELRYFEVEQRDHNNWKQVNDAKVEKVSQWENAPMFEMKNLKASTYYKVEVRAHNSMGYSQDDRLVFRTATGSGHSSSDGYHGGSGGSMSAGAIAAIIIVLILIILVVLDVTCYVRNRWGVLFLLRNRVCSKDIANNKAKEAAADDAKGGSELAANNGNIKLEVVETAISEKGDSGDTKSKTEVDNPAFDKEKEPLKSKEDIDKDYDGEMASEETPMIQTLGAKDIKANDGMEKNKSPKGSKSSVAKDNTVSKDSLV